MHGRRAAEHGSALPGAMKEGLHRCNEGGPHWCNGRGHVPVRVSLDADKAEGAVTRPLGNGRAEPCSAGGPGWSLHRRGFLMHGPESSRAWLGSTLCDARVPAQVQRKRPRSDATKDAPIDETEEAPIDATEEAPTDATEEAPTDATKKAPQCGAFFYFDAAPISASSNRRTRRWTWCSSSCRAGIPLRPFHPSDAAACAGSRSSAAVPVRSAGLRDGYPSG